MRVVITDTAFICNHNHPALEVFKNVLLVVCLDGKVVTDQYDCFVSPYNENEMGPELLGEKNIKYKALESVADFLEKELCGLGETILFLTDDNPESLYPFHVLKNRVDDERTTFHLYAVSPFRFDSESRIQEHKNLLADLTSLTSILYIDSDKYFANIEKDVTEKDLRQNLAKDYFALLPTVVNHIEELCGRYYFDFTMYSYVMVENGFNRIDLSKRNQLDTTYKIKMCNKNGKLGIPNFFKKGNVQKKKEIERVSARIDGKNICEYLRKQRMELARVNGIDFFSEKCSSVGPCAGTCDQCDLESAYLRDKLAAILPGKRVIPDFTLTEWEVRV